MSYYSDSEVDELITSEYKKLKISKNKNFKNILKDIDKLKKELFERITISNREEYLEKNYILSPENILQENINLIFSLNFNKYDIESIKKIFKKVIEMLVLCNTNNITYDKTPILGHYQKFIYNNINLLSKDDNIKKLKKIKGFNLLNETNITSDLNNIVRVFPRYDKSTYKSYINTYLDYMIKKYNTTDKNRVLNTLILISNQNIDFKYFKTFFKILMNKVKSLYKPYGFVLQKLIENRCDIKIYEYIYNYYENYLVSLKKQPIRQYIFQNCSHLKKCICVAINYNDIKKTEELYKLLLKYYQPEIKGELYLMMINEWQLSSNHNVKLLLKISEYIKNSSINYEYIFNNKIYHPKDMYTLNILINAGLIDNTLKRKLLNKYFSLDNLINFYNLYKNKNIKKLIREKLLYNSYSNNKLRRIINNLKILCKNDKYLEKQFKYVLNKKTFIEEFMEEYIYIGDYNVYFKKFINMCNIFYKGFNMEERQIKNIFYCINEDSIYLYELVFNNSNKKIQHNIEKNVCKYYQKLSDDVRKEKLFNIIDCLDINKNNININYYIYNNGEVLYKIDDKMLNLFGYSNLETEINLVKEIIRKFPFITTIDDYYTNFVKNNVKMKECIICFENELCYTFRCHDTHSVCINCFPKMIKKECPMCRMNMGFVV